METAIERVMHTYGMIQKLTADEERAIRADVTAYMTEQAAGGEDEQRLTISGLKYLRERYS